MLLSFARPGRLNSPWLAFLGSVVLFLGLLAFLLLEPAGWFRAAPRSTNLMLFCAAGIRGPVEEVLREYEERYGVRIQPQYMGSNALLAAIEISDRGDLYLPADDSYVALARSKGLIDEVLPLARMKPVLAVRKSNPKMIRSIGDVLDNDVRVSQANPEAAAVGKLARDALTASGQWDGYRKRIVVTKPTVNDVSTDILTGAVDAGVVWDATVAQTADLEAIAVPAFEKVTANLSVCVLKRTTRATEALRFARYLAARDRGLPRFQTHGFVPVEGDPWQEVPELRVMAGAMLRPAIEETITAFEQREGVKVTRVYNGCGILVAQMRTGAGGPDAYFACDQSFMDQVSDLFPHSQPISTNQLVILVPKDNPHGIGALKDLGKPGLRVGIGHEKQCAMGVLTQATLRQDQSHDLVMRNVKVQSPTGDMLVNQLRTGSLDAAITYISNAAGAAELKAIPIAIPCAIATQPIAVGKDSAQKHLAGRLVEAIRSTQSRQRFTDFGFHWLLEDDKVTQGVREGAR
jgi:molybdenum ABC transporter molybdate-binding protein